MHLIGLPRDEKMLKGLEMELDDACYPLLEKTDLFLDNETGFKEVDAAILVGAKPRGPGMERKDLLVENHDIFQLQGAALDKFAKKSVKVLVVGNPANTNCLIASSNAPSIPKNNFSAMTRLDHNRAVSFLKKAGYKNIKNVCVWGNHSPQMLADLTQATAEGGFSL